MGKKVNGFFSFDIWQENLLIVHLLGQTRPNTGIASISIQSVRFVGVGIGQQWNHGKTLFEVVKTVLALIRPSEAGILSCKGNYRFGYF